MIEFSLQSIVLSIIKLIVRVYYRVCAELSAVNRRLNTELINFCGSINVVRSTTSQEQVFEPSIGPRAMRSARVSPSTNSSTRYREPFASARSWIPAILG
jgi:hypothetical protein